MATIPNLQGSLGIPATYSAAPRPPYGGLLLGSSPLPVVVDRIVAASQTIPAFTPVGLDGNGRLVIAEEDGNPKAVGITLTEVTTTASTDYKGVPILVQGAVDYDVVAWPSDFDTAAKRFRAFDSSPSPTAIVVKRREPGLL